MMRRCLMSGSGQVDGQLFSELGYREINTAAGVPVGYQPSTEVRVERSGEDGALVTVKSLRAGGPTVAEWVEYWARGGNTCLIGLPGERPPALPA